MMDGKVEIIWGARNPDGTIHEFGRTDPTDSLADVPAEYLRATKRGTNVSFMSDNEELVGQIDHVIEERKRAVEEAERAAAGDEDSPPEPDAPPAPQRGGRGGRGNRGRAEA